MKGLLFVCLVRNKTGKNNYLKNLGKILREAGKERLTSKLRNLSTDYDLNLQQEIYW